MFNLSYTEREKHFAGVIHTTRPISHSGLGRYIDVYGNEWDVNAIINRCICAVPMSGLHPYYNDTSGANFGCVRQTWLPYKNEIVSKEYQAFLAK